MTIFHLDKEKNMNFTSSSLMAIGGEYKEAFNQLTEDNMEDFDWVEKILLNINQKFEEKAQNVSLYVLSLESEVEEMESQRRKIIDIMDNKIDKMKCRKESIRQYLFNNMKDINKKSIKTPIIDIVIRKNPPRTIIEDESKISQEYKIKVETIKINKNLIKQDIKLGKLISGAFLQDSESLIIKSSI